VKPTTPPSPYERIYCDQQDASFIRRHTGTRLPLLIKPFTYCFLKMAPTRTQSPYTRVHERSANNLDRARTAAASSREYNSDLTRAEMTRIFGERSGGQVPYPWQLDVSEAFLLGLNCVVIAGTGAGKTTPFLLPLLVEKNKKIIIISPLKALQRDQVRLFFLFSHPII
jgi:hypothetical protein